MTPNGLLMTFSYNQCLPQPQSGKLPPTARQYAEKDLEDSVQAQSEMPSQPNPSPEDSGHPADGGGMSIQAEGDRKPQGNQVF